MTTPLFAGLDVSTQSCKLIVIDPDRPDPIFNDAIQYDEDLPDFGTRDGVIPNAGPGVSESDPRMWIEAVEEVLERLRRSPVPIDRIACLSVSGQQHGLVALDGEGRLARSRSKLWNDFSTIEECRLLTDAVGGRDAMLAEISNTQRTGYTASKILHMVRHEPEVYERAALFLLVHNYINRYLTGGVSIMEPGDTSGTALWNPATGRWSRRLIDAIGPGLSAKLPPVGPADRSIGAISPALASRFGFSPSCRIDAGSGDNMYGAVGTGNVAPGIITLSLGTSGTACTVMDEPFLDPAGEIASYCDSTGRYLPLLCVSNLANGYDAFLEARGLDHDGFSRLVRQSPAGCHGRILIPWFTGERTPDLPLAAPLTFGFDLKDFTRDIMARAILEGHVLNLHQGFRRMPVQRREIRLTGGLSRSEAWCQAIADVFECETVPVRGEGAALGAAVHAAWVWFRENGRDISLQDLTDRWVILEDDRRKRPDAAARPVYRKLKELYAGLCRRLTEPGAEDPFRLRRELAPSALDESQDS